MYFDDMSRSCQVGSGPDIRAIGWLDDLHPFPTGEVPLMVMARLAEHIESQRSWQPVVAMGLHNCELCAERRVSENMNLRIPGAGVIYVAPVMILHYIEVHRYLPPEEFIHAVIGAPLHGPPEFEHAMAPYEHYWDLPEL